VTDRRGYDLRCAMNPGNIERELGWHPGQDFNC
jgi:dTDP-D-glucose 4,6-dehydratase